MGFTKIILFVLTWSMLCWKLTNSMPISFVDFGIHSYSNRSNVVQASSCSCGFYESDEIDSESQVMTKPLVHLQIGINSTGTKCGYTELIKCRETCKNSGGLLIEKLCKEKGHWITKPGCIFYKNCRASNWVNTGNCISYENLHCCHNGNPANCSQIDKGDKIAYVLQRLFSKLLYNSREKYSLANDKAVTGLIFSITKSELTNEDIMKALNFKNIGLFDLDDYAEDENTEMYPEDTSLFTDYFDSYVNFTTASEDENKRNERYIKLKTTTMANSTNNTVLSNSLIKTDNITSTKNFHTTDTDHEILLITTETSINKNNNNENSTPESSEQTHPCKCNT